LQGRALRVLFAFQVEKPAFRAKAKTKFQSRDKIFAEVMNL